MHGMSYANSVELTWVKPLTILFSMTHVLTLDGHMDRKQRYFIGYSLSGQDKEVVDLLREMIATRFNVRGALSSPPHITLFRPFEMTDSAPVRQGITALARTLAPFTVPVTKFADFDQGVWFLEPAQHRGLLALKEKIAAVVKHAVGISENNTRRGVRFHVTLAYKDLTPETHRRIGEFLRHEPLPLATLNIDSVTLFGQRTDGTWEPKVVFPFGDG